MTTHPSIKAPTGIPVGGEHWNFITTYSLFAWLCCTRLFFLLFYLKQQQQQTCWWPFIHQGCPWISAFPVSEPYHPATPPPPPPQKKFKNRHERDIFGLGRAALKVCSCMRRILLRTWRKKISFKMRFYFIIQPVSLFSERSSYVSDLSWQLTYERILQGWRVASAWWCYTHPNNQVDPSKSSFENPNWKFSTKIDQINIKIGQFFFS